ncbi:MAG: C4-dicarboxylate ABC transporter permease [Nitrospira bacterium SG8_3]|nr:MAG: C4-dicarboxylate ABC transporter permease [Nitrospira bacterium SG8_3]
MGVEIIGLIGIGVLLLLLFSGMWLGFAMGFVGFLGLIYIVGFQGACKVLATLPYTTTAFYPISALPLFVLMGLIVGSAGLSTDLYDTAYKWFGRLPGGLAISTVFASGGFAAITGSSSASLVTIGSVALPEMKKYKYDPRLATGTVAAGGTIGILIPPSLGFILYAILTEESIGRLFMAGIIPGILEVIFYVALIYIMCLMNPALGPRGPKTMFGEKIRSLKNTWPVLLLFALVIGGIYGGIFTPTEAGAIGAFGAMVIILLMGRLNLRGLAAGTMEALKMTGMILILVLGAFIFAHFLALSKLPFLLSEFITGMDIPRYATLVCIIFLYIILGMFLEIFSSILLTVPILFPSILAMGFDPIWFGVIMVRVMEIGLITPPIGMNVFMLAGVTDTPLGTIFRGIVPFVIADFVHVALLVIFPQISLYLPQTMF